MAAIIIYEAVTQLTLFLGELVNIIYNVPLGLRGPEIILWTSDSAQLQS